MSTRRLICGTCSATLRTRVLAVFVGAVSTFASAEADERLTLEMATRGTRPQITVIPTGGQPDAIRETSIASDFKLSARLLEPSSGYRILAAELVLKGEGGTSKSVAVMEERTPSHDFVSEGQVVFDIDPRGPTAQNAVALCSGASVGGEVRSLSVPVLWRVKSGRFDFRWIRTLSSNDPEELLTNSDYYAEQQTENVEAVLEVDVTCEGSSGKFIASKVKAESAKATQAGVAAKKQQPANAQAQTSQTIEVSNLVEEPLQTQGTASARLAPAASLDAMPAKPDARQTANKAAAETFTCEGGMVRQMGPGSAEYVCLCPGNTRRESRGAGGYSCERRLGRRS